MPREIYSREVAKVAHQTIGSPRYRIPDWAYGTKFCETQAFIHTAEAALMPHLIDPANAGKWDNSLRRWVLHGHRVYVPTKELVMDLRRTSLRGLDMPSLPWPLESFMVCLPKEIDYPHPGKPLGFFMSRVFIADGESFCVCAAMDDGSAYSCTYLSHDFSLAVVEQTDFTYSDADRLFGFTHKTGDKQDLMGIVEFAIKFLSYLCAVPEDMEAGYRPAGKTQGKPAQARKGNQKQSARKPWIVGLDRQAAQQVSHGGKHRSPIAHWRCGHWRHQRYGVARAKTKLLWIQPTIISKGS